MWHRNSGWFQSEDWGGLGYLQDGDFYGCSRLIIEHLISSHKMDPMANKYPLWKRLLHKFQARRDVPFRNKFFVGYDLHGNTYWEFTVDGNMQRLRRKLEPYQESIFKSDYFETVPPQWLQWLRRMKKDPPTLQELINDQARQVRIKMLAEQADRNWTAEKERLEAEQRHKLQQELQNVEAEKQQFEDINRKIVEAHKREAPMEKKSNSESEHEAKHNPWAEADEKADQNPIQSATIQPRK